MIYDNRWQVILVFSAILVLMLAIFWPGNKEEPLDQDVSGQVKVITSFPAKNPHQPGFTNVPVNPFAENNYELLPMEHDQTVSAEITKRKKPEADEDMLEEDTLDMSDETMQSPAGERADWSKWRKPEERIDGYLGGPPGPGAQLD